ncbi:branched-chain amino acid ABC transporter permease [Plastoroseomonas hellenica]|uniref:branched-chain amino acid ABC transporter permease n=1 Tax=Plastoroseomonas hellenica TaxID=2687306 RepID=UPI001BAD8438|nr:branched-chain amino acid ABC transporter permease [Plastoroseomonas hellenica]MBR0644094.1 branched-chain amino acid ABC transporter permease [Plastoroseomonas hellenica]
MSASITASARSAGRLVFAAFVLLALLVWPLLVENVFYQRVGALVMLAALSASAWNLVGGYAGQISIGHVLFFGCGAYASLLGFTWFEWPPIMGAPFGIALSLLLAVLVGLPTLRLKGHYFSMATIALAELARIIVVNSPSLGGGVGISGPAIPRSMADLSFISPLPYYYIFGAVLAVLLLFTWWMGRARMGFYLRAIRGQERAARSLGVPAQRYKLYALLVSAGFTSLAGSLYAAMVGFVDPDSGLGILLSVKMVIVSALGGAGTLFGPLVGAAILVPLEEFTNAAFGGDGTGITYVVYGAIIMLISRYAPGGLAEILARLKAWGARHAR